MDYKNQAVSKKKFLAEIKLMLTNIIIVIIIKRKIKNFKKESIIYTILIISKYKILSKLRELRGICLIILSFA